MAQAIQQETYEFLAKPQVVKPRPKYRAPPQPLMEEQQSNNSLLPANLMFDKRVIRGNTYANSQTQGEKKLMTMKQFKKQDQKTVAIAQPNYAHAQTPRPVASRHNIQIQTDEFIETLTDKPPDQEMDAQTDYYIDKPPDRLFKPRKNGVDKDTQIWESDLFDFDQEVEPILQVLMNKILEQSRMEVLEEEELKRMKQQQKLTERDRNSYLSEMQRLEAVQQRLDSEEQRRKLQYETVIKQQELSHKKIVCRQLAKQLLKPLKSNTIKILEDLGVFRDPLQASLFNDFLPWVFDGILIELSNGETAGNDIEILLDDIENTIQNQHSNSQIARKQFIIDHYEAIEKRKRDKEEAKRLEIENKRLEELEAQRQIEEQNQQLQADLDAQNNVPSQVQP